MRFGLPREWNCFLAGRASNVQAAGPGDELARDALSDRAIPLSQVPASDPRLGGLTLRQAPSINRAPVSLSRRGSTNFNAGSMPTAVVPPPSGKAAQAPPDHIRSCIDMHIAEISRSPVFPFLEEFIDHPGFDSMGVRRAWTGEIIPHTAKSFFEQNGRKALQMFNAIASNSNGSRSARLASLWNLIKIAEQSGEVHRSQLDKAYHEVLKDPKPGPDQQSRASMALIFAQVARERWHGMSASTKADLAQALIQQIEDNDVFLDIAYPELRDTLIKDILLGGAPDSRIRQRLLAALQTAQAREQTYRPPAENPFLDRLMGFASAALADLLTHQWKAARTDRPSRAPAHALPEASSGALETARPGAAMQVARIVHNLPIVSGQVQASLWLRAFDFFEHAAPSEKDQIAATVFNEVHAIVEPSRKNLLFKWGSHSTPSANDFFKHFAVTKMCVHHLLNQPGGRHDVQMLQDVFFATSCLHSMINGSIEIREGTRFTPDEKALLMSIAFEAERMNSAITEGRFIDALCEGRPQNEQIAIQRR